MAGPSRAFWLAVLLLALLYTHGVNGHNAATHASSPVVAVTATTPADSGDHDSAPCHHDGDEAEHGSESCASGQPQYRADLPVPGTTPLRFAELTRSHVPAATAMDGVFPASSDEPRDPGILRV